MRHNKTNPLASIVAGIIVILFLLACLIAGALLVKGLIWALTI